MRCPLCRHRKPRRSCPALGQEICAVCCGTKRQIELQCPPDCVYLRSARTHPPAIIRRQRERDVRFLLSVVHDLSEPHGQLLAVLLSLVRRHRPAAVPSLVDDDVASAAGALAATAETADRGIIYEHQPASRPAQDLGAALKAALDKVTADAPSSVTRDVAAVLRALERLAREASGTVDGGDTAFLQLLDRLADLQEPDVPASRADVDAPAKLIVPG